MKNRFGLSLAIATCLATSSSFAQSQNKEEPVRFSYNYAQLAYFDGEFDGNFGDADVDGISIEGSYRFTGNNANWFLHGGFFDYEFDGTSVDGELLEIGAGYIFEHERDYDLYATVSLLRTEVASDDDTGFGFGGGIRYMASKDVEIRGSAHYEDVDDSVFYLNVEGDYFITPELVGGLTLSLGDIDGFWLRGRFYFD